MCGRFVSASPPDEVARYFRAQPPETVLEPSYNVAPTSDVYVVLEDGSVRRMEAFHWGLVPPWAPDPSIGNRMINARAETVATKSAFRNAFRRRRCIIPVDGFYEWAAVPGRRRKQPYYLHRPDGEPLALAGLWERWSDPDRPGGQLRSCTIITTSANDAVRRVHDRMPVILPPATWDRWLDPDEHDPDLLGRLLVPAPPSLLELYPVSTEVNDVRHKGSHLLDRVEVDEAAGGATSH